MTAALGPLRIAPLTVAHLAALMTIDAAAYPQPWSKQLWKQELDRPNRFYFAALAGDTLVGFGGALLAVDEAHVTTIATDPCLKRQGVATALMLAIIDAAVSAGATGLTLEVRAGNTSAQRLYRSFAMVTEGVRRNYYERDGEDAFIMWARNIDSQVYTERLQSIRTTLAVEGKHLCPAP